MTEHIKGEKRFISHAEEFQITCVDILLSRKEHKVSRSLSVGLPNVFLQTVKYRKGRKGTALQWKKPDKHNSAM